MSKSIPNNWEAFWKENPTGFNSTMLQSTRFFAENLNNVLPILSTDRFLDIGCGPGFLVDYLRKRCEFVHGTDISAQYIAQCEAQFADDHHTEFSVSKSYDYLAYDKLICENQINKVVMLSVLQYYSDENEVRRLITELRETATKQPFNCLLADIIPKKHSTMGDILSIIKHSIKKGYTFKFMKFLAYALFSDYSKVKKNGFLQIDESFFINLGKDLAIDIEIIKDLTIHTGRYSVLIRF